MRYYLALPLPTRSGGESCTYLVKRSYCIRTATYVMEVHVDLRPIRTAFTRGLSSRYTQTRFHTRNTSPA